jgi:Ca2+-binding RTX toxin-like protein
MAITITASNANGDANGVNFNGYLNTFDAKFENGGRGFFSDNPLDLSGDEYAVSDSATQTLPISGGRGVIMDSGAEGDLSYDFMTHTLGGTLDAVEFGTGLSYNSAKDDFTTTRDIAITGLDLSSTGAAGEVHQVVNGLMTGDATALRDLLKDSDLIFRGSTGRDTMVGFDGDDTMNGGAGNDYLRGNAGEDSINGGAGNDFLYGQDGDDRLSGSSGHDVVNGGAGDDVLIGGGGRDRLIGGAGNDTFVFGKSFAIDTVLDFQAGAGVGDVLSFASSLFSDFQDVLDHTADVNGNAVITFNATNKLTLIGVTEDQLAANDFLFT